MKNKKREFKVGDLVVPAWNPTTIQRVTKVTVEPMSGGPRTKRVLLTCRTVWNFEGTKTVASNPRQCSSKYRHLTFEDVNKAILALESFYDELESV